MGDPVLADNKENDTFHLIILIVRIGIIEHLPSMHRPGHSVLKAGRRHSVLKKISRPDGKKSVQLFGYFM